MASAEVLKAKVRTLASLNIVLLSLDQVQSVAMASRTVTSLGTDAPV
jgi:hypothetical protein